MLKPLIVAVGALLSITQVSNQSASAAPYRYPAYRQAAYQPRTYARPAVARAAYARPAVQRTAYRGVGYTRPAVGYARPGYARVGVGYARVGYARPGYAAQRYAAAPAFRARPLAPRGVAANRTVVGSRFVRRVAVAAPVVAAPDSIVGGILAPLVGQPAPVTTPTISRPAVARRAAAALGGGGQVGQASYYALTSRTASGGSVGAATCAHRSLPFGTRVLVTNLANSHQMVLTVNDRGPFIGGRIIDVSRTAAGALGMLGSGTAPVRVQVVGHS